MSLHNTYVVTVSAADMLGMAFKPLSAAEAATNIEDSAAARCQRSAVSTQLSVQRSASKISRNFFAKCKEVTEEKLKHRYARGIRALPGNDLGPQAKRM